MLLAWLFTISTLSYVRCLPHILLTTKSSKCFRVEVVRNTTYEFNYSAPDLIEVSGDEPKDSESIILDHGHGDEHPREMGRDGLDSRYEEVFRRRMEAMKKAVSIELSEGMLGCGLKNAKGSKVDQSLYSIYINRQYQSISG